MAQYVTRGVGKPSGRGHESPEAISPATSSVGGNEAGQPEQSFSEAGSATVAALLHLVRLMGAELVLMRGSDIAQLEQAVRTKLGEFTSPTANRAAREAGLAQARYLVEQVLTQVRAQAELKKSLNAANRNAPHPGSADPTHVTPTHLPSKLLN
jgi:hypothetical protein